MEKDGKIRKNNQNKKKKNMKMQENQYKKQGKHRKTQETEIQKKSPNVKKKSPNNFLPNLNRRSLKSRMYQNGFFLRRKLDQGFKTTESRT